MFKVISSTDEERIVEETVDIEDSQGECYQRTVRTIYGAIDTFFNRRMLRREIV